MSLSADEVRKVADLARLEISDAEVDTMARQLSAIVDGEPSPPTQFQPKIPKDLETICLVCPKRAPTMNQFEAPANDADVQRLFREQDNLGADSSLFLRAIRQLTKEGKPIGQVIG